LSVGRPKVTLLTFDFFPIIGGQGRSFVSLFQAFTEFLPSYLFRIFAPGESGIAGHIPLWSSLKRSPHAHVLFSLLLSIRIRRLLKEERTDLLLVNGGPGGVMVLRRPQVPVIICVNHTYSQQTRYLPAQGWKRALRPLERRSYGHGDHFVAISSTTASELVGEYGIAPTRITVIHPPVDVSRFFPEPDARVVGRVLYVGRLEARKGPEFLVSAFCALARQLPNVSLYLAGTGSLEALLRERVRREELEERVTFLGFIPESSLASWYRSAHVVVVPSHFEGLGLTALEALACGAPVIATRVPGLVDAVTDNVDGSLVEFGDEHALVAELSRYLTDPDLARACGVRGAEKVRTRFSPHSVARQYDSLFQNLLNGRATGRT
jgi:glycosyltransferase involved in cell wall biosynthesis